VEFRGKARKREEGENPIRMRQSRERTNGRQLLKKAGVVRWLEIIMEWKAKQREERKFYKSKTPNTGVFYECIHVQYCGLQVQPFPKETLGQVG